MWHLQTYLQRSFRMHISWQWKNWTNFSATAPVFSLSFTFCGPIPPRKTGAFHRSLFLLANLVSLSSHQLHLPLNHQINRLQQPCRHHIHHLQQPSQRLFNRLLLHCLVLHIHAHVQHGLHAHGHLQHSLLIHQPNHTNTGDLPDHLPGSFAAAIFHAVGLWTCFACASASGFVLIFGWRAVGKKAYTLLIMHLSLCGHTPVRKGAKFLGVFQSEITWCTVTPHHPRFSDYST